MRTASAAACARRSARRTPSTWSTAWPSSTTTSAWAASSAPRSARGTPSFPSPPRRRRRSTRPSRRPRRRRPLPQRLRRPPAPRSNGWLFSKRTPQAQRAWGVFRLFGELHIVGSVDQDAGIPPGPAHLLVVGVVCQQDLLRAGGVVQAPLDHAGVFLDVRKMRFDVCGGHHQAVKPDLPEIGGREVPPPAGGDVAALHDQVLAVLDGGLDDLPHDGPQTGFQLLVILRGEMRIAASDEPHFQKVHGQAGTAVFSDKPLRQQGLACVGGACDQNDHGVKTSFPPVYRHLSTGEGSPQAGAAERTGPCCGKAGRPCFFPRKPYNGQEPTRQSRDIRVIPVPERRGVAFRTKGPRARSVCPASRCRILGCFGLPLCGISELRTAENRRRSFHMYTHPFSAWYWRDASRELRDLRKLLFAALMIAMCVVLAQVPSVPLFGGAKVTWGFLARSVCAWVCGPVLGLLFAFAEDILSFFLTGGGGYPFFPGYTLTTMLGVLTYALFLYRAPLRIWRIFCAKLLTNVQNVVLGALWMAILNSNGRFSLETWYASASLSAAKNLIMLPVQTVLLVVLLRALQPALRQMGMLPRTAAAAPQNRI